MKKNHQFIALNPFCALNLKLSLAMKISLFLLFFAVFQIQAGNGYAQKAKVSVSLSNVTLEQVLDQIERNSDYVFLYNDKTINKNRVISVNVTETEISKLLSQIFAGTNVKYTVVDKQIILSTDKVNQSSNTVKIKGVVVDSKGDPLIGANVSVKGTTNGTITDLDGNFELNVDKGSILTISYAGYISESKTVNSGAPLSITLNEDNVLLDGVVVTALGIKRSAKSLTYNVQELKGADLSTVKDASFVNSLAGKVAGVTINQSASGIGGSTRVIMRGTKSLFGDNNALYVIDGIPVANIRSEQPEGFYETPDGGDSDGISNINPDDIESMSVLTGAAAAALYGAQGANGVILITTKKGKEGKLKVNYSNDTQFLSPFVMPKFQNTYGSKVGSYESWGDKLETPTDYDPKDFFQTGYTETNSLSLSAGTDRNQTYFSAATTNSRGIIPNNTYNRYNFSVRNTTELIKDKLTLDLSASYIISNNNNMMSQGQFHNPLVAVYLFPRGDDMNKYKTYEHYNSERNFPTQFWPYGAGDILGMENPYWTINRENLGNNKQRYMYTGSLRYKILDWLNMTGRIRVDNSEDLYQRKISASSSLLFASENGNYMKQRTQYKNTYGDAILNIDKRFKNFGIVANLGGSFADAVMDVTGYEGHLLKVANLFTFANIDTTHPETRAIENGYHDNNQAVFGTFQLSYKSMLFLDVTGRNDWYSSLAGTAHEKSGFFYPSVGLSGVVTEMVDLSKAYISFLKVRASYSEVGNAPQRFITTPTFGIKNGVVETLPSVPADFLKPERTKAFEVGANIRLLNDKINLDVTYYNSNTYNQLFTFAMNPSSGLKNYHINGGKVSNWGIEASIGYKQDLGPVNWHSNLTFTLNRNKIKELIPENFTTPTGETASFTELRPFGSVGTYTMILKEGGTMNDIYVSGLLTDEHGNIKVSPLDGSVQADPDKWIKAGSAAPRFNYGWNNTFSYKGFNLGVLIDARIGGIGVSATQALMDRFGVSKASADARDNGGIEIHGGKVDAEKYYSVTGGGNTGVLSQYVYSATNVRLREASLGYTFPGKWFNDKIDNLSLSLIGRNLFMFYNKAPFDPELASSTSTYYQGIDYFMQPSLRSIGFSVKVQF